MRGVDEGLELADGGGIRLVFHAPQPVGGEPGEPRALVAETRGCHPERDRRFRDMGEIDVRGDVAEAGFGEGIVACLMPVKGAQGAVGARLGVVVGPGESVVDPEQQALTQSIRQRL